MKKKFIVLLGIIALIGSVGCKQEWTSYEEWQVASKQQIQAYLTGGKINQIDSVHLVRNAPQNAWSAKWIGNFNNYQEGFEYVVLVRISHHANKRPGSSDVTSTAFLDHIVSQTKKDSDNIPTDTIFIDLSAFGE